MCFDNSCRLEKAAEYIQRQWKDGIVELWNVGANLVVFVLLHYSNLPLLHYSHDL